MMRLNISKETCASFDIDCWQNSKSGWPGPQLLVCRLSVIAVAGGTTQIFIGWSSMITVSLTHIVDIIIYAHLLLYSNICGVWEVCFSTISANFKLLFIIFIGGKLYFHLNSAQAFIN